MSIRLRQIALVAADLEPAMDALCTTLGTSICFRDPGVAEFGLVNALTVVGDQFVEIVSPVQAGTTAGRLLDKRGGDGGYMVIVQADEQARLVDRLDSIGVRCVWRHDGGRARGAHLHPRDVGGAIVSIDWMDPPESWLWAGLDWNQHVRTDVTEAITAVTIAADDPLALARRWAEAFDLPQPDEPVVALDGCRIEVVPAGPRGEGFDGFEVRAADRRRAGERYEVAGVTITFA
jgi:hypothetical protein